LRTRDPARAREAILAAAVVEFGSHGFAGARTAAIAQRAGVSTQLLTHHFGGKQGVLDELRRRWNAAPSTETAGSGSFRESLTAHMSGVLSHTDWSRLVLWHALEGTREAESQGNIAERMAQITETVSVRQRSGELNAGADPRFIALLSYLIAFAPLSLPDHLRGLLGYDGRSSKYQDWAAGQLTALLTPADPDEDGASGK
jgi:TetR/AcrR family transcriptional regulator